MAPAELGERESWLPTRRLSRLRFGTMPDAKTKIALEVNGEPVEVAFAPHKTLLELLREDLSLTGTKHGCELGECGTCTVLVDGTPVLSCLVLGLACEGRRVKTVEGMAAGGTLHPLQDAFAELGAAQCGYCPPAFLLAAEALLRATAACVGIAPSPAAAPPGVRAVPGGRNLPTPSGLLPGSRDEPAPAGDRVLSGGDPAAAVAAPAEETAAAALAHITVEYEPL